MRIRHLALPVCLFLVGCYPIELDSSAQGTILIPRQEGFFALDSKTGKASRIWAPTTGAPLFAKYSPDGKQLLAVTGPKGSAMMASFTYTLVTVADGKTRQLTQGQNGMYLQWSPTGKQFSIAQGASQPKPPMQQGMPEILVVNVQDGTQKVVAGNVAAHHRWLPGGKGIVIFQAVIKEKQKGYTGTLAILDPEKGTSEKLATVMGEEIFFDVSPDGNHILFTAKAAALGEEELKPSEEEQLFHLDRTKKTLNSVMKKVRYVLFSPKGGNVLVSGAVDGSKYALQVTDLTFAEHAKIAADAAKEVGGMGNNTKVIPGWLDDNTVIYLAERAVYGTAGKNLMLTLVSADGKTRRSLQTKIDTAAGKGE